MAKTCWLAPVNGGVPKHSGLGTGMCDSRSPDGTQAIVTSDLSAAEQGTVWDDSDCLVYTDPTDGVAQRQAWDSPVVP